MNDYEKKMKFAKTCRMIGYVMMSGHEYKLNVKPEFYLTVAEMIDPQEGGYVNVDIDESLKVEMSELDIVRQKLAEAQAEIVRLQALVKY